MRLSRAAYLVFAACASGGAAEDWFDRAAEKLTFSAYQDTWRTRVSGLLTLEGYHVAQPPPGMVFTNGHTLFGPRLALFADSQLGEKLSGFVQVRADRGFDPTNENMRVRLDEYALRIAPWKDGRLNFQVGQFATVVGNWVQRHDARDNPFVTAPLPYEHMTNIYDGKAPHSPLDFTNFEIEEKYEYNPIVWGPAYATGAAVSGRVGRFTYAFDVKNAGPGSRPPAWAISHTAFGRPAYSARLGFKPDLRWNFGVSASDSAVYEHNAWPSFPEGRSRHDYDNRILAADAGYAWGRLQAWAEIFHSRYEVPRVGAVHTVAGYVETKYKFTPQLYGAFRWNRQVFSKIDVGAGRFVPWTNAIWRIDAAAGYRFTAHLDFKAQISMQHEATRPRALPLNLAAQFNVRL